MPQIRAATLDDADAIAGLCAQLGYPTTGPISAVRLTAVLRSTGDAVFVACLSDGLVVGWVHVFLALRIESNTFAELGGFVVAETHRGRGIGRALLVAAEQWGVEQGVFKLRVRTRSGRVEARAFYERLGFELIKEQHIYDKGLGPSA
jgi:GNAT superfamily N-acetyltransferase